MRTSFIFTARTIRKWRLRGHLPAFKFRLRPPLRRWKVGVSMAPKKRASFTAMDIGLETEQGRQLEQLLNSQRSYVVRSIQRDPQSVLPLLVAALDSQAKQKKNNGWFAVSCRQFKNTWRYKCFAILKHVSSGLCSQHDAGDTIVQCEVAGRQSTSDSNAFWIPSFEKNARCFVSAWSLV